MAEIQYYTIKEVCEKLRLSRAQVSRYVASGELRSAKFGRARRVPDKALEQFCEREGAGTGPKDPSAMGAATPEELRARRELMASWDELREKIRAEAPDLDLLQLLLEAREELAE